MSKRLGKQVIEIEVKLHDHTNLAARPGINGNDRFRPDLTVFARPNDAGIDRPSHLSTFAAIHRILEGEFDERDELIEGLSEPDILHVGLQIGEAVLDGEPPVERGRMLLDVHAATAFIVRDGDGLPTARNVDPDETGNGQRAE